MDTSEDKPSGSVTGTGARAPQAPDAQAAVLPPNTNRGAIVAKNEDNGDQLTIGLHWLTVTVFTNPSQVACHVMATLFGEQIADSMKWVDHFIDTGASGRRFKSIRIAAHGIKLYSAPVHGAYCSLEIPGEAIEIVGETAIFELLSTLGDLKRKDGEGHERAVIWRATRLDLAFDHAPFKPRDCYDAWLRHEVRCSANWGKHKWEENPEGQLFRVGARSSQRYLRIYDRRGFTRVELEFKSGFAEMVANLYVTTATDTWREVAVGLLRDYVDFVDPSTGGSVTRAALLPWWHTFVGAISRAKERPRRVDASGDLLRRKRAYLERMLPTLYVFKHGLQVSLDDLCEYSEDQLENKHRLDLAELRRALGAASL